MNTGSTQPAIDQLLTVDALPAELKPLFQAMRDLIEGQRSALLLTRSELTSAKNAADMAGRLLNDVLIERIELREQLAHAQRELQRTQRDAAGWKARSELVEK